MKVREYLKNLTEFLKENPESSEHEMYFAADDEGIADMHPLVVGN